MNLRHGMARVARGREHTPRFVEQHLAGRGQIDTPRAANEQRPAQVFLQRANRCRQSGLHEIEAPRRAREMPLFSDRHEMLKLFQVHSPPR